jgi:hypothetical protein
VTSEKLVAEARGRGMSAVGSGYQAMASEDWGDFMSAVITVIVGVCNSVRLL